MGKPKFFYNFMQTDGATTVQVNQVSAGIFYAAFLASRPNDDIGMAITRIDYNDQAAETISLANQGAVR